MFRNYLKIAIRNLWRKKIYTIINVLGLILGFTCAFLLYLYIHDELNFDNYHQDKENVYKIEAKENVNQSYGVTMPGKLAEIIKEKCPQVVYVTRVYRSPVTINIGTSKHNLSGAYLADPTLFRTLTFKPIVGNIHTALVQPRSVVLTKSLTYKFFRGPKNAIGKVLQIANSKKRYVVKAVIEDIPNNSHFRPSTLISMSSIYKTEASFFTSWGMGVFDIYLKLKKGVSSEKFEKTLTNVYRKYTKGTYNRTLYLTKLTDLHLRSKAIRKSKVSILYIFSVVAVFILLITIANYMNLTTAQSIERAREVGIRKVVGAYQRQLIQQFLLESVLLSLIAFLVSLSLVEAVLPWFNQLTDKVLFIGYTTKPILILSLLGIALLTGLLSGSYPALVLSGFRPAQVLKGRFSYTGKGQRLRKALIIFQFSISTIMIISTWIIHLQMRYVANKDLGFNKAQMMAIALPFQNKNYSITASSLSKKTGIAAMGGATFGINGIVIMRKMYLPRNKEGFKLINIQGHMATSGIIRALGLKMLQGKSFEQLNTRQYGKQVIVNETFIKQYNIKKAIGKRIGIAGEKSKPTKFASIVGVVADFHNESLYETIKPMVIILVPPDNDLFYAFVKLQPQNMSSTIDHIRNTWNKLWPENTFSGVFLDKRFTESYRKDQKQKQIFLIFSGLTIFIAFLGLFGLASFTVNQRNKEIGIRKVLGASIPQILTLVSGGFVRVVFVANLIAFPLAYYFVKQWLRNFAYRIHIPWWVFVLVGLLTLLITLIVVNIQSLRVARVNPVDVLKDE